jgi:hypothetical protein
MGEVIAFRLRHEPEPVRQPGPVRKLRPPPPPWRRKLIDLWMDEANWEVREDGGKTFTALGHEVTIFAASVPNDDDLWWSFFISGEMGCRMAWWEPAEAEFAAWEALITMVKRRMKRRKAKR